MLSQAFIVLSANALQKSKQPYRKDPSHEQYYRRKKAR